MSSRVRAAFAELAALAPPEERPTSGPLFFEEDMRDTFAAFAEAHEKVLALAARFYALEGLVNSVHLDTQKSAADVLVGEHGAFQALADVSSAINAIRRELDSVPDQQDSNAFCVWFHGWTAGIVTPFARHARHESAWEEGTWDVFKLLLRHFHATAPVRHRLRAIRRMLDKRRAQRARADKRRAKRRRVRDKRRAKRRRDRDSEDGHSVSSEDVSAYNSDTTDSEDTADDDSQVDDDGVLEEPTDWKKLACALLDELSKDPFIAAHPPTVPAPAVHPGYRVVGVDDADDDVSDK